jgi:hypothetical protein
VGGGLEFVERHLESIHGGIDALISLDLHDFAPSREFLVDREELLDALTLDRGQIVDRLDAVVGWIDLRDRNRDDLVVNVAANRSS